MNKVIRLIIFLLLFIPTVAWGTTYFVSPADTTPPSNYIKIWTGGTDFYYMTANPEPAVADVKSGVTYGWDGSAVYTGTLATGGGGASAW